MSLGRVPERASAAGEAIDNASSEGRERTSDSAAAAGAGLPARAPAGRLHAVRGVRGEFSSWPETAGEKGAPEGAMTGRRKL